MTRDFLDLAFTMESGRELDFLTRFEGPITLRVTGDAPPNLSHDLSRLLSRIRNEAGINITRTDGPNAAITIEAIPRAQIRRSLPQAACFVAPNVSSISEYRGARRQNRTNWALWKPRTSGDFLPSDASPQEVRDCLHEELAQAIGPLNDLYRLPDSVFNDDNVHAVLTGFDMLMLRVYYHPTLANGMTRTQVAARVPSILRALNPRGETIASRPLSATPRAWIDAIQTALGPGASGTTRKNAANYALRIAEREDWRDHRRAFSHYAMGRILQSQDAEQSHAQYQVADKYYRQSFALGPHRGFVATQLAAYAIVAGDGANALAALTPHLGPAAQHENAALLSTLMLLQAEALELEGRADEARNVRVDSLGWARYGFGADWAVRAKLREVASLSPLNGRF